MKIAPLPVEAYRNLVARALAEDIGSGDATSALILEPEQRARGVLIAKSELVLCGLDVFSEALRQCDPDVVIEARRTDGDRCEPGSTVAHVVGEAGALLAAERTGLNFVQRLSGIATGTAKYVEAAAGRVTVLDTRKTTPTFRDLEKYAVRCGGGTNHRRRLDDGILIKENHKRLAGGITQALGRAARSAMPVEIEVETLAELDEAL